MSRKNLKNLKNLKSKTTYCEGKYFVLYDYLTLNAEKEATVEFNFPEFAKNMVRIQIIDGHGNMVYREIKLVEKRENATKTLIRRILSGR